MRYEIDKQINMYQNVTACNTGPGQCEYDELN